MLGSAVHPGDKDVLDCGRKGGWEKKEGGEREERERRTHTFHVLEHATQVRPELPGT